jgi:hypothetical protein
VKDEMAVFTHSNKLNVADTEDTNTNTLFAIHYYIIYIAKSRSNLFEFVRSKGFKFAKY